MKTVGKYCKKYNWKGQMYYVISIQSSVTLYLNKRCYIAFVRQFLLEARVILHLALNKCPVWHHTHSWYIRMHFIVCNVFRIFNHQTAFYFVLPRYLCFAYYTLSIRLRKIIKISVKKFWKFNSYKNSFLIHLKLRLRRCTDTLIYCAIRS